MVLPISSDIETLWSAAKAAKAAQEAKDVEYAACVYLEELNAVYA